MLSTEILLLRRLALRHARQSPRSALLLVAILGLGVGVFVAIRLANRAAVASFSHFTAVIAGQSDWIIQPPAGTLPESVLPELRAALGARPVQMIPVVESTAAFPAAGEAVKFGATTYTLLGVDLIAVANLAQAKGVESGRYFASARATAPARGGRNPVDFWESFGAGPQVWISPQLSRETQGAARLALIVNEQVRSLPVAGVIPNPPGAAAVPVTLLVLDLPQLQQLTGKAGQLDRVEFVLEPGPREDERRAELRALLEKLGGDGRRWSVTSPGARRETAATMTRAFRLNLTVLSLIALLVGLYLIFEALDGAVVRRRGEIAILRSLGVEERTIQRAWLVEAAVLGLGGGILGVLLGWAGAQLSVRAVGQTVNALYFATTVESAGVDCPEILLGLALGVVTSLVAGWWPAREAARTPPAQVLVRHVAAAPGPAVFRSAWLGAGLVVAGVACTRLPPLHFAQGGRFPLAGYLAAALGIFGGGVLGGFLLPALAWLGRRPGPGSAPVRVALSHLANPSGRHRLAVAALLCAISMTAGMAILVASFDATVRGWVQRSLQADLYISSRGAQSASSQNRISPATWRAIAAIPGAAEANVLTAYPVEMDGSQTMLTGTDLGLLRTHADLPWVQPPLDDRIFDQARNAGLALASESFVERFGKKRGDQVRLPTPSGPQTLTLAGIYADYGNERGSLLVDRERLVGWFRDDYVTSLSLFLRPGTDAATVRAGLLARYPGLAIFTNASLRAEILRIFRQTFSITYALEVIGVVVAVIGLALTLISILLDRREELTTLRALGFNRHELAWATALEGAAVSAGAVVGGATMSLGLGWLLIYVINKQSFGWTLGFSVPWGQLAGLNLIILTTGLAVSYAVGYWGAGLPADREE